MRPRALARLALGALAAVAAHLVVVRPRLLRWGATDAEIARLLPGDELVAAAHTVSTRAVGIDAPPGDIWPWLVQMGDGRGGLYSYDALDRLFGYISGPSATTILVDHQSLAAGDVIPLGRGPDWPVAILEPERALVLEPVPGRVSWCFALEPDGATTRLVSRVRVGIGPRWALLALAPVPTCRGSPWSGGCCSASPSARPASRGTGDEGVTIPVHPSRFPNPASGPSRTTAARRGPTFGMDISQEEAPCRATS